MKNTKSFKFISILILLASCQVQNSQSKNKYSKFRFYSNNLRFAIQEHRVKFDQVLSKVKDTTKTPRGIQKIAKLEELKKYSTYVSGDLENILFEVKKKGTEENIQRLMLEEGSKSFANTLTRKFDNYFTKYQQKNLNYFSDTTSWSRRYIKLIPENTRDVLPNFGKFYFENNNKEEVLIALYMFLLGIEQEALEIQQKIINEK